MFFNVWLIAHPNTVIVNYQIRAKFLYLVRFSTFLYMFRALYAHHQEDKLY
jgi:hypothetical protein